MIILATIVNGVTPICLLPSVVVTVTNTVVTGSRSGVQFAPRQDRWEKDVAIRWLSCQRCRTISSIHRKTSSKGSTRPCVLGREKNITVGIIYAVGADGRSIIICNFATGSCTKVSRCPSSIVWNHHDTVGVIPGSNDPEGRCVLGGEGSESGSKEELHDNLFLWNYWMIVILLTARYLWLIEDGLLLCYIGY
jgi:hypothetical protein